MLPGSQGSLFQPPSRDVSVRVGPAGWNYKDWDGVVYPKPRGRSFDPLSFLADYYDTIEINSSFYSPPKAEAAKSWATRVRNNPRFRFTAKAWQRITHNLKDVTRVSVTSYADQVRRSMAPLAEAGLLGALLLQFPWSFRCNSENLEYLQTIFQLLDPFPLVLEVRHGSWDREQTYQFLREHQISLCNLDQPIIGDSLRMSAHVTARIGYLRLHGRNYQNWFSEGAGRDARYDYLYTRSEIKTVARTIKAIRQRAEETYVVTNNHFRGQALVNALEILEELDAGKPAHPPLLGAAYPHFARGE